MKLVSKRPVGRHRRATSRARSAAPVALAMVGATAISASAHSSSSSTDAHPQSGPEEATDTTAQDNNQAPSNQNHAAQAAERAEQQGRAAAHRAEVAAARQAAVNKLTARRAAKHRAQVAAQHHYVLPMSSYAFTSTFGERWGRLHAGIDLATPVGTKVGSMSSGVVVSAGVKSGYGNTMIIRYWDGTTSLYGHLSRFVAHEGQHVAPGQLVAYSGNSGHSTGPHLHLEIRPKNSLANELARAGRSLTRLTSSSMRSTGELTMLASQDAMARAGVEPAPVNPLPWLKAHGILPKGAH